MIDRNHKLSLTQQATLLGISRGGVYYEAVPVSAADLALMRRIDELHLEFPFAGSRMLRGLLAAEGSKVGRRHVTTLMRRMGIETIYRRPNNSKPAPGHRIYPYLLRGLAIDRANQVWAIDITYIPMARGFVYLAALTAGIWLYVLTPPQTSTLIRCLRSPGGGLRCLEATTFLQFESARAFHCWQRVRHSDDRSSRRPLLTQQVERKATVLFVKRFSMADCP
jgi:putative transposase